MSNEFDKLDIVEICILLKETYFKSIPREAKYWECPFPQEFELSPLNY